MKVTEPVGAVVLLETVAVRVTDWPMLAGFTEDATDEAVLTALIIWLSAGRGRAAEVRCRGVDDGDGIGARRQQRGRKRGRAAEAAAGGQGRTADCGRTVHKVTEPVASGVAAGRPSRSR
jgi:hypothetical protein